MKQKINWVIPVVVAVLVLAFVYLVRSASTPTWLARDNERDKSRFEPRQSVDIAMAMKLVTHEAPEMLNPPSKIPPLLLYPPSAEDLARLSGP
jgi:hypothetical protein